MARAFEILFNIVASQSFQQQIFEDHCATYLFHEAKKVERSVATMFHQSATVGHQFPFLDFSIYLNG